MPRSNIFLAEGNQVLEIFAHSVPGRPTSDWEPLAEHLAAVGGAARGYASVFGASGAAEAMGRLHQTYAETGDEEALQVFAEASAEIASEYEFEGGGVSGETEVQRTIRLKNDRGNDGCSI